MQSRDLSCTDAAEQMLFQIAPSVIYAIHSIERRYRGLLLIAEAFDQYVSLPVGVENELEV